MKTSDSSENMKIARLRIRVIAQRYGSAVKFLGDKQLARYDR